MDFTKLSDADLDALDREADKAIGGTEGLMQHGSQAAATTTPPEMDFSQMSDDELSRLDADLQRVIDSGGEWTPQPNRQTVGEQSQDELLSQAYARQNVGDGGDNAFGDAVMEGVKGAGRAAKAIGSGFVGLGSGVVRLAGTPVRAVTGWDGLHRAADAIDSGYENWGADALASELPDDDWGRVLGGFGEKIAGTAGSLAALGGGGKLASAAGAALKAAGHAKTAAVAANALPLIFGNDAAVRTYDTAKENGSGTARALGLASVNGAIHYLGFKMFENQSLNKMLGMPQEMTAMMPGWANAAMAKNAAGNTFTSLASGVRNGMFKYILAERAKGALKAGGIMGLQNFLSSIPTQMAEGAGVGDVDWGRAVSEGVGGVEEGALMEALMGGAAALKTPKAARKFIADTYFRNGYKLPNGQHVPGLLHSEEGRSFVMKQNPEMQRRILDILDHGGKVTKGELNAACLPPDMTEAELREFAKDWRKDLASEWDRAAEPEALGEGEELEGNEPVIPREQQMRNRAKVNEMRDHDQRVAEAEAAERARAEEQAADDAAVAAEEANWAEANAKADAERAEEAAGAERLAREDAYPQPVAEQPAAPEQAPAQEPTEPPVIERSNRLRRNLNPKPQQEIPNETGNVPVEAQPEPPVQDAGRGGQRQAPQAAEGLVEGEAPRGEVPAAGEVETSGKSASNADSSAGKEPQAEDINRNSAQTQVPVSKSDNGGQKLTGGAKEEATSAFKRGDSVMLKGASDGQRVTFLKANADGTADVQVKTPGANRYAQEKVETRTVPMDEISSAGMKETLTLAERKRLADGIQSQTEPPSAEPQKNAPASAPREDGTTTPPITVETSAVEKKPDFKDGRVRIVNGKDKTGQKYDDGSEVELETTVMSVEHESKSGGKFRALFDYGVRGGKKTLHIQDFKNGAWGDIIPEDYGFSYHDDLSSPAEQMFDTVLGKGAFEKILSARERVRKEGKFKSAQEANALIADALSRLSYKDTTPPQGADAPQGAESAAGGATGGAAEEPKPTQGNKLRRGKKGKKLEAQEPKADAAPKADDAPATQEATPEVTLTPAPAAADQTQPASQFRDKNGNMKKTLRGAVERIASAIGNRTGKGAITPEEADAIVNGIAESPEAKHNRSARFFTPLVTDAEWQNSLGVDAESAKNLRDAVVRARDASQQKKQQRKLDNALMAADAGDKDAPTAYGLVRIASDALDKARTKGDKAAEARAQKALEDAQAKFLAEYEQVPEANREKFVKEQEKQFEEWSKKHDDVARNESVTADAPIPGKDGSSTTLAEQLPAKSTNRVEKGRYGKGYVGEIKGVDGDEVHIAYYDADGKFLRDEKVPLSTLRERGKLLEQYKELADAVEAKGEDAESTSVRFERAAPESPADRDAKFAADADYQRWLKARKANDAEPLRQRYEMEQAKALGDAYQNAVRGVDVEYVDRDYDPAIDGGGDERKSVGGIYTGTAADYANRSRRGGVDDGPSLRKVGTGEGSQVYGWGLYGSDVRGVADNYARTNTAQRKIGKSGSRNLNEIEEIAARRIENSGATANPLESATESTREDYEYFKSIGDKKNAAREKAILDELVKNGDKYAEVSGSQIVYEQTFFTDRAPGDESHLMKWYEPVTREQMDWIESRLKAEGIGNVNMPFLKGELPNPDNPSGGPTNAKIKNGRTVYDHLANKLGSPKAASEFLARAGIDGVKYPVDSYGSKGVKDGDKVGWNYVSFRDDNIRVDHKWEGGNLRYLRDRDTGTVLGIFNRDTGKLKLFRGASWKTLNHELGGHATMRLAEQEAARGNRSLLDKINEAVDGAMGTPLADEVRSRYPDADEATLRDEIWAALRERPSEAMQKYVKTLQGRKWYNRAWDAIKTAWRGILSRMGFNRADLSGIDKMTPDEFNEFLDKAMIGGKTLGRIETQGGESSVRMARGPAAPSNKDVKLYLDDKEGFWKKVRRMFQDKNIILRDVEERLGITKKEESAYYAKDAAYGKNEHELTYLQKQEVEPIVAKIEKSGGSLSLFSAYLYARHSGERNAVMKAEKGIDNGSGMTKDQADAIFSAVDRLGLRAAFEDAARDVWAMNRKYLQRRADSGRMTQAEVKFLLDRYKHYVPLRNDMSNEELEMFNSSTGGWKRNELRTAKGRREAADDPFAFSIVQSEEAIRASNANEARRKFAGVVRRAAAQGAPIGEVVDGENKGGATWSFVFKDGGRIDTGSPMRLASERDDIILFKENGKLKAIKIDPGKNGRGLDLARAVTDKDVVRFNRHLEWIPRATRWMSAMRTQYVPTFIIRNMKADNLEVLLNALSERGVKGFKFFGKFVANEVSVAKGVKEYFKTGKSSDKYVQEAVENGLLTGGGMAAEGFSETTRRLSDTLAALRGGKKGAAGRAFGAAKDLISLLNSCAEYNTRMGVYKTLREEGMSVADAVSYARDVTVNFNRKGYLTPYTNAAFMFSNASIQGMGRAFKSIKSEHGKEVIAGLFLVGAAQAMLDDWLGHDDNDKSGGADSRNLTEFDKSHSLGVALPSGHRVKTGIRNPWALPVYMGRKTVELVKGLTSGEDAMKDIANEVGQFATEPVGGNGFGSVSEFLQTLAPTIIDPFVQWGTGKDYRGHDRVKKSFNQYEPDSWNGRNSTPEAYKAIAKALNFVSGGGEHRKGAFDTSPENWKLLTETVFGGVLTDANNVISAGEHAVKAVRGQPAPQIVRDVPFVRDTFTNMPDSTTRYYEAVDSYNADKNEFKKTTELGRRAEMKKAHPYLTAQKGRVDALIEQVQELTHRERGEVKVGQKWVPMKTELPEARKEAFRKRRLRLQAEVLRILGK